METISYEATRLDLLPRGATFVLDRPAIHEVTGPGATQCLQGMLTNDLDAAGTNGVIYAAGLTPKGMIVVDYWVLRIGDRYLLVADRASREVSADLFRRQLPPRLARASDRSDDLESCWLLGTWDDRLGTALGARPEPGRVITAPSADGEIWLATAPASERAPFRHLAVGPAAAIWSLAKRLEDAAGRPGTGDDLRAMRVLAGFPTLRAEIDDKTLPQEVDYDGVGGVSYSKGCYTGQETVARLHFRGHSNWLLRGIELSHGAEPIPATIEHDGKPAVRLGTLLDLPDGLSIGLAKVRRELEPGSSLEIGDRSLRITTLPFQRQRKSPDA